MRELKNQRCFSAVAVVILFSSWFTLAITVKDNSREHEVSSSVYLVRLKGAPVSDYHGSVEGFMGTAAMEGKKLDTSRLEVEEYAQYLQQGHNSLLEEVLEADGYEKLYSYTLTLNAFSVKLVDAENQEKLLKAHPSVTSIEPDRLFQKATTHTPEFLELPTRVWPLNGGADHAGEGIVIGMLDTGIDPKHPSFTKEIQNRTYDPLDKWKGRCFVTHTFPYGSCNGKIIGAQHFSKGLIAANLFNATYDFDSPFDGDGHGTHTSSIAAGNHGVPVEVKGFNYGTASGVAPRARIAVYKVVFRDGGFLSDVLAGIDQAVLDGVDVLSISLGSISIATGAPFLNTFDIALLFAVKAGVSVVHAAGNNGPYPFTMNSYGPWIISVGATLTDRTYLNPITLQTGEIVASFGLSAGSTTKRWHQLIYSEDAFVDTTSSLDFEYFSYCQDPTPFNATLVKNKILICNYIEYAAGDNANQFQTTISTAMKLSAAGLIIISGRSLDVSSKEKPIILDPFPFPLPGAFISDANISMTLLDFYYERTKRKNAGKVVEFRGRARLDDSRQAAFVTEAPAVDYYSSRGPVYANTMSQTVADVLKPDLVAPGNQIWGAWTPSGIDAPGYYGESFAMLSGTSMAAPHVAGIIALLKQQHPQWGPAAIHSAILTTASSLDLWQLPIQAEQPSQPSGDNTFGTLSGPASPFDLGNGAVNASAAMNPGIIFERDFQGYINFLCSLPGVDANTVEDVTGSACNMMNGNRASDLNMPSITVANLIGTRQVNRTVTSYVPQEETYSVIVNPPTGVKVTVNPQSFTIRSQESVTLSIRFHAVVSNQGFTFGSISLAGNQGHAAHIPVSISADLEAIAT